MESPGRKTILERAINWLTPARCRWVVASLILIVVARGLMFLHGPGALNLSGDEAQYWDWSRNLQLSYYSKGPLVAYIIRASCAIFGDTAAAIRYPAVLFAGCTILVTYLLTRELFSSDRLALLAVLLSFLVPIFLAGSVLMTIDPPFYLCWGLATYFAARAIFRSDERWWAAVGIAIGVGFLAKYAAMLWFVGLVPWLIIRKLMGERAPIRGPILALLIAGMFTIPVIVWNAQHDWVSFKHVGVQTGTRDGGLNIGNVLEMVGSQIGLLGPGIAVLMVWAIFRSFGPMRTSEADRLIFLVAIGATFWVLTFLTSLRAKVQPNWPAPAYFSLLIVTAWFIARAWNHLELWKRVRPWVAVSLVTALLVIPIAQDTAVLVPVAARVNELAGKKLIEPRSVDLMVRLRGWSDLGRQVSRDLEELGEGSFVLCDDYQQTALMAFYVDGRPITYCAGPYYSVKPKRLSQYDLWANRNLDGNPALMGRNAVFVGKGGEESTDVMNAFDRTERQPELDIVVHGIKIGSFKTWKCYGFRGMKRSVNLQTY